MARLAGFSHEYIQNLDIPLLDLVRTRYLHHSLDNFERKLKDIKEVLLLAVRDPFERLVSAYNDKILNPYDNSYHDEVLALLYYEISTSNELLYFLQLGKKIVLRYRTVETNETRPSFEEFCLYVVEEFSRIDLANMDQHWAPVSRFCLPCRVSRLFLTIVDLCESISVPSDARHKTGDVGARCELGFRVYLHQSSQFRLDFNSTFESIATSDTYR